jgi:hypothetical protein
LQVTGKIVQISVLPALSRLMLKHLQNDWVTPVCPILGDQVIGNNFFKKMAKKSSSNATSRHEPLNYLKNFSEPGRFSGMGSVKKRLVWWGSGIRLSSRNGK